MKEILEERLVDEPVPQNESGASGSTGQLRLHCLKSRIFGNRRLVRVWVPPGYDDPENHGRRYPVLYLNDGQNLFDSSTAFTGVEWQVDETAERLIGEQAISPLLIVGVDNAQDDRIREYVPYPTRDVVVRRVEGNKYPAFLLEEVIPHVRKRYRIALGPENTGLGGSSLGGYISLYTAVSCPRIFGRLLVESPSLYLADRRLLREAARCRRWPRRVYIGVGTQETGDEKRNRQIVEDVRSLAAILRNAGLDENRLKVEIDGGGTHSEEAWGRRLPGALKFLFC